MIEALNLRFMPMLESKAFSRIFNILIYINPVALAPQVWVALTAQSTEGISIGMLTIFIAIQVVVSLQGIRIKSTSMFLSMAISAVLSATIIAIVLIRG